MLTELVLALPPGLLPCARNSQGLGSGTCSARACAAQSQRGLAVVHTTLSPQSHRCAILAGFVHGRGARVREFLCPSPFSMVSPL